MSITIRFFAGLSLTFALNTVGAVERLQITPRCVSALSLAIPQVANEFLRHSRDDFPNALKNTYQEIDCKDEGDLISISFRKAGVSESTTRDGEEYFLIDTNQWKIVEKWIGGGGWIDPEYENKVLKRDGKRGAKN
jgi:hypothetical protein